MIASASVVRGTRAGAAGSVGRSTGARDTLDVRGLVGHAGHPDVLKQAGAMDADLIIAVTQVDEINMVACQVAHTLFAVPKKIARVRQGTYLRPEWRVCGSLRRIE